MYTKAEFINWHCQFDPHSVLFLNHLRLEDFTEKSEFLVPLKI